LIKYLWDKWTMNNNLIQMNIMMKEVNKIKKILAYSIMKMTLNFTKPNNLMKVIMMRIWDYKKMVKISIT
jgi:hypothetical protein